jgi:hypothetical protein
MNAFFTLPLSIDDLDQLCALLADTDCIVSYWPEFRRCDWRVFAEESIVNGETIFAHLDTNVLSYLVDIYDGRESNDVRRRAAALLAIAIAFNMKVNPTVAIHEYALSGSDEPDERLAAFYALDNTEPQVLIDYALGRTNSITFPTRNTLQPTDHRGNLATPIRGHAFYSALVYKIGELHLNPKYKGLSIPSRSARFEALVDWMFYELGFSAAVVLAAAQLWGNRNCKAALKIRAGNDEGKFFRSLENSIWDIVALETWAEYERKRVPRDPMHLLLTFDTALAELGPPLFMANRDEDPLEYSVRTLSMYWSSEYAKPLAERYLHYQQNLDDPSRRLAKDLTSVKDQLRQQIVSYL